MEGKVGGGEQAGEGSKMREQATGGEGKQRGRGGKTGGKEGGKKQAEGGKTDGGG